jgi:hypothetical protein
MIELQKEDIEKLDIIIEEISDVNFFGIDFEEFEKKRPNFFVNIKVKKSNDLEYSSHKRREFERLACIVEKYNCGEVERPNPLSGRTLNIKKNSETLQFKKQGGFKKLYKILKERKKRENTEFELAESNIRANNLNEKHSKRNLFFAIINIIMGIINFYLIMKTSK